MHEQHEPLPDAQYEPRDIGEGFMWGAVAVALGTLLLCALIVLWLYPESTLDRTLTLPLPKYPAPALQTDPEEDMKRFHTAELRRLDGTGWVDASRSVVHIPIADAMRIVAHEGVAGWPGPAPDSGAPR
jgi:hypothetical protein